MLEHENEVSIHEEEDLEPDLSDGASIKGENSNNSNEEVIAHKETKKVGRLKLVVLAALVVSAVVVAVSVHTYITKKEQQLFEEQFEDDTIKVLDAIGATFDKIMWSFESVESDFLTIASVANQTWPFVTIPDFSDQMTNVLALSGAIHVGFVPVVAPELRMQWEEYAADHHEEWINEAMTVQEEYHGYYGPIVYNASYEQTIHNVDGPLADNSR
jgi:cell division protein FtsL